MNVQKGDKLVYPGKGVITVKRVKVKFVAGKEKEYAVASSDDGIVTFVFPVDGLASGRIRPLITATTLKAMFAILRDGSTPLASETWNRRYHRCAGLVETGDPLKIAEVFRDLRRHRGVRDLSFGERKCLRKQATY